MKFEEAMTILRNGGKVRRPCWKSAYIFLAHDGKGPLCLANGMPSSKRVYFVGNVTSENIVSEDWEEPYIADILGMDKGSDWSDICIRARVIRHDRDNLDLCLKMLENHIKKAYSEVFQADADKHWFGHGCQAVTDIVEALKRERAIKEKAEEKAVKYKEWTKRLEQKLIEIQDICER